MFFRRKPGRPFVPWFKRLWIRIVVIGIFVMLFGGAGLVEWSHQPKFCVSCHIMKPYYKAWTMSSHGFVSCVDCHYVPGWRNEIEGKFQSLTQLVTYLNGTYGTNPSAQIQDASCLQTGCHETRLMEGMIEFKQGIKFDHRVHIGKPVRGITLRCTSCHSQIVQGNHMAVTETVCFTCHFKGRVSAELVRDQKFCTFCHNPPEKPIKIGDIEYQHSYYVGIGVACQRCHQDVMIGDGNVAKQRCVECHPEEERLERWQDFDFMHEQHVTKVKIECFQCHDIIQHRLPVRGSSPIMSCDVCHLDSHESSSLLYSGVGGRGDVAPHPAPMFAAQVDCIGCHTEDSRFGSGVSPIITSKADVKACETCHPSGGQEIFDSWKKTIPEMLKPVEAKLAKAQAKVNSMPMGDPRTTELQAKYYDARYNYNLVVSGNAVHNIEYAQELIDKSSQMLDEVLGE